MNNNELGEKIRKARGDLSLRDFAKKCGISHTHLDSIETVSYTHLDVYKRQLISRRIKPAIPERSPAFAYSGINGNSSVLLSFVPISITCI